RGGGATRRGSARVFVPERRAQHRDAIARPGARRAVVPAEHGAGGVAAEMRRAGLEIERSALDADARLRAGLRVEADGVALHRNASTGAERFSASRRTLASQRRTITSFV